MSEKEQWGTQLEIKFIRSLGEGNSTATKLKLVSNYYEACKLRVDWGEMDKYVVLTACRDLIKELQTDLSR